MAVGTTIKTIQDIMRKDAGVDGDAQRISQLSWMLFLKIFDDKEKEYRADAEGVPLPDAGPLRWRNWAADPEGITGEALLKFIDADLFPDLKGTAGRSGIERFRDPAAPGLRGLVQLHEKWDADPAGRKQDQ